MKKTILLIAIIIGVFTLILIHNTGQKTTTTTNTIKQNYVALGDSVAAGVGLEYYSDSSACDRTNQSYPNIVASSLNFNLTNLACSGATLPNGILGQQDVNDLNLSPQVSQLFKLKKPSLITLTIGANDIGWTNIITKCYTSECGSASDTAGVNAALVSMSNNLSTALTQIKNNYGSSVPEVIVTGYHQVFPTSSLSCGDLTGIDATELTWGRSQQANLNSNIQAIVAQYSFAKFAPVNFSGHELCTTDSWVQGLSDNAPYHPTAEGQQEYANSVISSYKSTK